MKIQHNTSLKTLHTFGVEAKANRLIQIYTINDILLALTSYNKPYKILGSGSNMIPCGDVNEVILKNEIKGIEIVDENDHSCMVKVGGGENWHQFVMWAVQHGLGGLENLALIPGTVGAAPIQNIGAYGVEQDAFFHSATVVDLESGLVKTFFKDDCHFGYRDSIFKNLAKDQYFVSHVTYVLHKNHVPITTYKDIQNYFNVNNISNPNIEDVADAVINIRTKKLPNPKAIGNAGSFFKNPIVDQSVLQHLLTSYPEIVHYPAPQGNIKLSAAWMIDQCGFKGIKEGNVGTYKNQALVLINYGNATGEEVLNFALKVQTEVFDKFGVELEPEVNIWG